MPTRLCHYCRRHRNSDTCVCITEGTRNIYFCAECSIYATCECLTCRTPIRNNRSHWITGRHTTAISDRLYLLGQAPGVQRHGHFGRVSEYMCTTCFPQWQPWTCGHCNNIDFLTLGHQPHTSPDVPGTYCSNCISRFQPCVRCNAKMPTDNDRRQLYNTHQPSHGHICASCRNSRFVSTSHAHNKFSQLCGYEIEFLVPIDSIDKLRLHEFGIIKYDGSIAADPSDAYQGQHQCWEFNSFPCSGDALYDSIKSVLSAIESAGGYVNRTCGIHFHFDMSQATALERDNFIRWWRIFEPVLFDMLPASRRNNRYCARGADGDRYRALNWRHAYHNHQTFEVRMHHATLSFPEVWSFCTTLLSMFATLPQTTVPTNLILPSHDPNAVSLSKRESAMLLFQQCALPMSMRKSILRRIRTINSYQYRAHHWRKPRRPSIPPLPQVTNAPTPINLSPIMTSRLAQIHGSV